MMRPPTPLRTPVEGRNDRHEDGFTLVELLVVTLVMGVVLTAVSTAFISMRSASDFGEAELSMQNVNRVAVERVSRHLRQALSRPGTNIIFDRAESDRVIFYADIDDDGTPERIRLDFDERQFVQYIAACVSSPCDDAGDFQTWPDPDLGPQPGDASRIVIIAEQVQNERLDEGVCRDADTNLPVISYYRRSAPTVLEPVTPPVPASLYSRIAAINIELYVDAGPEEPDCDHLETLVHLRNWSG